MVFPSILRGTLNGDRPTLRRSPDTMAIAIARHYGDCDRSTLIKLITLTNFTYSTVSLLNPPITKKMQIYQNMALVTSLSVRGRGSYYLKVHLQGVYCLSLAGLHVSL